MMEEQFPVNSGNVPPPSQSTNLLSHQLANFATFQQQFSNGQRRKAKDTQRSNSPKLKLERILGLTSTSSNILATANELIAYAAGAVVVIYNHKRNKQVALLYPPPPQPIASNNTSVNNSNPPSQPLILPLGGNNNVNNEILTSNQPSITNESSTPVNTRAKPISCLAFSPDGNYLAAGEMGHQPRILIWDVKEKKLLREFKSHKFGVLSLSFSPNMRYLVSIGFQHDGYLYVWDWRKGMKLAGNKVTSRVNAVSFSQDGSYFVTAGLRHVKFWYLDASGRIPKRGSSRETQVLDGRSGILGVLRDANFVDVACDRSSNTGYTYFITDAGILCIFKEGRVIDKWVDLQVKNAFSIDVSSHYVICTCSEGVIRLFDLVTLKYAGILPKPHPLGTDISLVTSTDMVRSQDAFYPDAVAMVYNALSQRVIAVYSDRSLYVWDIRDLKKIAKYRSFIFHSDCVWGVEPCPNIDREENAIPLNSFATFSSDGTVRIWNLDNPTLSASSSPLSPPHHTSGMLSPSCSSTSHKRNIYSRELIKMIYVDPDAAEFAKLRGDFEFTDDQCPDFGIRSLKMSMDGTMMASGDRSGNLRVHDMNSWDLLTYQEAHDSEILSIDMTTPKQKDEPSLIATASRDRLLHIFDIKSKFQLVQSLDDHSSSITAVKFSKDSNRLVSCGADKGIIFRHITSPITPIFNAAPRPFTTYHNYSGRSTVFDMALDVNGRYVATVTGERKLYVMSVESGKPFRICKPETAEEIGKSSENSGGSLINIDLDPFSGTYAVTSGSDRCIRLFDLTNSTCIEKVCAHSELITSVKFVRTSEEDGLRVISTCSDGTVFIWKVGRDIIAKMCARASERDLKMKQEEVGPKRLRRSSTVIRPTVSISQMIRQGERKTFSTMSPAEQKYDEMYKRIAASSNRKPSIEKSPPESPRTTKNVFARNRPPLAQDNGRKSPNDRSGKLDRLYNGLPTSSHGRDKLTPPPNMAQYRPSQTKNLMLRRAISKDALISKDEPIKKPPSPSMPKSATHIQLKPRPSLHRQTSDPQQQQQQQQQQQITEGHKFPCETLEEEDDSDNTNEDDETEEEEEEIIFTPEQDQVSNSFKVSTHHPVANQIHGEEEEEEDVSSSDGRNTPVSDSETNATQVNDEECSEDNVDDTINRDIAAREPPPRISTSLSRTTSSRRIMVDKEDIPPLPTMPSSPPNEKELYNSAAFKEIKKKLEKAAKRQSITTRYLSSLGEVKPDRPSLDHVMSSFRDLASPPIASISPPPEKLTIDVAPVEVVVDNTKLENALADLDGVTILLESVLETYLSTVKSSNNQSSLSIIETKLNAVTEKIASTIPTKIPEKESPETVQLLEKYSSLLLAMVESKIKA